LALLCYKLLPNPVGDVVVISQWLATLYMVNEASEVMSSQLVMLFPDWFNPAVRA
jgi:hypothetical protein